MLKTTHLECTISHHFETAMEEKIGEEVGFEPRMKDTVRQVEQALDQSMRILPR